MPGTPKKPTNHGLGVPPKPGKSKRVHEVQPDRETSALLVSLDYHRIKESLDKGQINLGNISQGFAGTILTFAVLHRQSDTLKLFLDHGLDVNAEGYDGKTALVSALEIADLELTRLLCERGADFTKRGPRSVSILGELVRNLLDNIYLRNFNLRNSEPDYLVNDVKRKIGVLKLCVRYAMHHSAASPKNNLENYKKYFGVCSLIVNGNRDLTNFEKFVGELEDPDFTDLDEYAPLVIACIFERLDMVKFLLKRGAKMMPSFWPKILEHHVHRLPDVLIAAGSTEIMQVFLDHHFTYGIGKLNYVFEPVFTAIAFHNVELVRAFLSHGVDLIKRYPPGTQNLLHAAVCAGDEDIVLLVLQQKVFDVNAMNHHGNTALHLCSGLKLHTRHKDCAIFRILLEEGANADTRNKNKKVPVHKCNSKNCDVVEYFKKVNLLDAEWARSKVAQILLNVDSNWDIISKQDISKYEEELEVMRTVKINSYKSLWHYIFFERDLSARYAINIILNDIYEENRKDFRKKFPHYGFVLNLLLRRGTERLRLTEIGRDIMHSALGIALPEEIGDLCFKYFSNAKLESLKASAEINEF